MIDKVSVAIELVRSEVKRSKPQVTVSLTVASCVQSDNTDQQLVTSCSSSVNTAHSLQQSNNSDHQNPHADSCDSHQQITQQQQQEADTRSAESEQKKRKKASCQQQICADHPQKDQQKQQATHLPGTDQSCGDVCRQVVMVKLVSDNYKDVMSQTVREVDKELKLARQLLGQCKESFHCLVSFYGENTQAFANDAVFWSDVVSFVEGFTACQRQLCKQMQVCLLVLLHSAQCHPLWNIRGVLDFSSLQHSCGSSGAGSVTLLLLDCVLHTKGGHRMQYSSSESVT